MTSKIQIIYGVRIDDDYVDEAFEEMNNIAPFVKTEYGHDVDEKILAKYGVIDTWYTYSNIWDEKYEDHWRGHIIGFVIGELDVFNSDSTLSKLNNVTDNQVCMMDKMLEEMPVLKRGERGTFIWGHGPKY